MLRNPPTVVSPDATYHGLLFFPRGRAGFNPVRIRAFRYLLSLAWLCVMPMMLQAASQALIVSGLSASPENEAQLVHLATETKRLLIERGFSPDHIEIAKGKVSRDEILAKIRNHKSDSTDDEYWLVLYGYSAHARGELPSFQIRGPRLTAADLKSALDSIPARQFVFIGTSDSGGFLPVLQNPRRTVISATKAEGETDFPRFPDSWIAALAEDPKATFNKVAARAAALLAEEYSKLSLVQCEHARMTDPRTAKIMGPPFQGVDDPPAEAKAVKPAQAQYLSASDIHVKMNDPDKRWEHQPATPETKEMIRVAQKVPNPGGHSAVILEQRLGFSVEGDRSSEEHVYFRVYLEKEDAVARWANYILPNSPPAVTTHLEVARSINPDGSAVVINPAKLIDPPDPSASSPEENATEMVFFPEVHAGCLIEIGYRTNRSLDAALPEVSEFLQVQREFPVLVTQIEVRVPEKKTCHVVLKNSLSVPVQSSENAQHIYRWELGALPAAESLPGDLPRPLWTIWLGISSLASWDDFASWYRRISLGADATDERVRKTAEELVDGATSRDEKIRRIFEFVSAFRYVAIEIGVQGVRARTPAQVLARRYGDCKDKANLLVSMLRSINIDAFFVLVNRGGTTDINFPSWQFNHAICFVPKAPDSADCSDLWLDSTDGTTQFGQIPLGDSGRMGLIFETQKAVFKPITAQKVSHLTDNYQLTQNPGGDWAGTFQRSASGLADSRLREAFRGLTPEQSKDFIYRLLAQVWSVGEYFGASISDVMDLRQNFQLDASVKASSSELPPPAFPWADVFSSPERSRSLCLNDGQPFTYVQTVHLHYPGLAPTSPSFSAAVAGAAFSVTWRRVDEHTLERDARIDLKQPVIQSSDYPALRNALRQWIVAAEIR